MAERRYSISQAGRLVGVENHVLRYWEDELHLEIPRDRKNQRYYTKLHIEMFQKINELKEKGYQLKAIEPVLKRMLAGEKDLDLNEVLRQNAAEILRQARLARTQMSDAQEAGTEPENVYCYAETPEQNGAEADRMNEESVKKDMDGETRTEVAARVEEDTAVVSQQEKLEQFQQLMNHIIGNAIGQAMRQNNEALSEEISRQVNDRMVQELEQVVAEGSGKKAAVAGFRIGGKTATSEKLPRSLKKYISSFVGFAPADDPQVIALITIDEPQGIYYGGTIAAPVIADIFQNILPYLGIRQEPVTEKNER